MPYAKRYSGKVCYNTVFEIKYFKIHYCIWDYLLYSTVQYSTVQYSTVQYSTGIWLSLQPISLHLFSFNFQKHSRGGQRHSDLNNHKKSMYIVLKYRESSSSYSKGMYLIYFFSCCVLFVIINWLIGWLVDSIPIHSYPFLHSSTLLSIYLFIPPSIYSSLHPLFLLSILLYKWWKSNVVFRWYLDCF